MPYGGMPGQQRSGTTVASGVIGIVLSAFWCLAGLFFLLAAAVFDTTGDDAPEWADDIGDGVAAVLVVIGVLILTCAIWSIVAAANLIRRRPWARIATIVTFSIWSAIAAISLIGNMTSDESDGGGIVMVLAWTAACVMVVVFAAVRATKEDVESTARAAWGGGMPPPGVQPPPYGAPGSPYGVPPGPGGPPPGPGSPPGAPPPRF